MKNGMNWFDKWLINHTYIGANYKKDKSNIEEMKNKLEQIELERIMCDNFHEKTFSKKIMNNTSDYLNGYREALNDVVLHATNTGRISNYDLSAMLILLKQKSNSTI